MADPILTIDKRLASVRSKLKSRKGKTAYKANIPYLEAEITHLENTRAMILEAREDKP